MWKIYAVSERDLLLERKIGAGSRHRWSNARPAPYRNHMASILRRNSLHFINSLYDLLPSFSMLSSFGPVFHCFDGYVLMRHISL